MVASLTTPLSSAEIQQFITDGYCVLRGGMSHDSCDEVQRRITDSCGLILDDPDTWRNDAAGNLSEKGIKTPLSDLFPECAKAAVRQLCGDNVACNGFTPIARIPQEHQESPRFTPTGRHIDGVRAGLTLYPTLRYLVLLVYTHDVGETDGCTSLYPGGHRLVFEHFYETGEDLSGNWKERGVTVCPDLGFGEAAPFVGKKGDILLFHYLMPHGGSENFGSTVRLALNGTAKPVTPYQPKPGPPAADWTPMDHTLRTDTLPEPAR